MAHQMSDNSDDDYEPSAKVPRLTTTDTLESNDGINNGRQQSSSKLLDASPSYQMSNGANGSSTASDLGDGDSSSVKHNKVNTIDNDSVEIGTDTDKTVEYNSLENLDWLNEGSFDEKINDPSCEQKANVSNTIHTVTNGSINEGKTFEVGDKTDVKPGVKRIDSVQKDAEIVSSILGRTDVDNIYEKLVEKRNRPNRVEVVTNDILENNENSAINVQESGSSDDIFTDVDNVLRLLRDKDLDEKVDPNEIFSLLEVNSEKDNRAHVVFNILLNKISSAKSKSSDESNAIIVPVESDLVDCVNKVLKVLPNVNPLEIFQMLESRPDNPERIQNIINDLQAKYAPLPEIVQQINSQDELNDPLIVDVLTISAMFPDKDKNEIYAYLEAHHNKPNRIQLVTDELLRIEAGSQQSYEDEVDLGHLGNIVKSTSNGYVKKSAQPVGKLQRDVKLLSDVFPDCEPNYLYTKLEDYSNDPERVQKISTEMFETRNYPKLKEFLEQQQKTLEKRKLQNLHLTIPEFLHMFSDPFAVFLEEDKPMSENYRNHALIQLKNSFPSVHHRYCEELLDLHNGHFTPSYKQLELECQVNHGARGNKIKKKKVPTATLR